MAHSLPAQVLLFLRVVQTSAIVLTGFVAIYLSWWHWILQEKVPFGLIAIIIVMSAAFLESYAVSAYTLSVSFSSSLPTIPYKILLHTTAPLLPACGWAYHQLREVDYVREWCQGNAWLPAQGNNVEKRNCPMVCVIIVTGGLTVLFTGLIAVFAGTELVLEKKRQAELELAGDEQEGFLRGRVDYYVYEHLEEKEGH